MGDEYVLVHVLGHSLCHDLRDVLREMAGSGAVSQAPPPANPRGPPRSAPGSGQSPPRPTPLPDAQHGPTPALFDAKAPVSAGAPAPPRWLAHLRGQDSGLAATTGVPAPAILCTPPRWMPSHPSPDPAQAPRTAARAPQPLVLWLPRLCTAVCAWTPSQPLPASVRTGWPQTWSLQRRPWAPSSCPDGAPEPAHTLWGGRENRGQTVVCFKKGGAQQSAFPPQVHLK